MYDGKLKDTQMIQNARITGASIFIERGMLTIFVDVEYGDGGGQSFGGYDLSRHNGAARFICRVLEVVGVETWADLQGKTVRIKGEPWGRIDSLGHFMQDKWFTPAKELPHVAL